MGRPFLRGIAILLFLTASAKLWSLTSDAEVFQVSGELFGLSYGNLLLIAAALELSVAAICLFRPAFDGLVAVAWLSTVFFAYRIGLWWIGWQKPCSCLGNLTDALHISPQLADNVMKGLLAFMLLGSVSLLFAHHRRREASETVAEQMPG